MELKTVVVALGLLLAAAAVAGGLLLARVYQRLRRIRLPPDADFFDTVRAVPLSLVVALDLLDLGLDVLSAPIIWYVLGRLRLQALRNVASFEALIPFTGPIPTLTLAWLAARLFGLGRELDPNVIETERVGPGRYAPKQPSSR
jgi:hypothetical protein